MRDSVMKQMAECEQSVVTIVTDDGKTLHGYVDVFESRYDNDGEASICFAGDDGEMLILEEHDIKSIVADKMASNGYKL